MLCLLAGLVAAPASAAPAKGPIDDSAASADQKRKALDQARAKVAPEVCDNIIPDFAKDIEDTCVRAITPLLSNSAEVFNPEEICKVVGDSVPSIRGIYTLCTTTLAWGSMLVSGMQEIFWSTYAQALAVKEAVVAVVEFMACVKDYECFVNDLKQSAVTMTTAAMTRLISESAFDSTSEWWVESYAAMAGLGLLVMAAMALFTAYQASRDRISGEDFVSSLAWFLPLGFFMMIFAPAIAYFVQFISNTLSDGVVNWMGDSVTTFLTTGTHLSDITVEGMLGGIVTGQMTFLLQALGALGITVTFEIQKLGAYLLGAVAAIGFGMYVHPKWRAKALRLPMFWVGIMFARPATLIVLGLITKYLVAIHPMGAPDPVTMFFSSVAFILAMLLVAFAPFTLLKYFPLLPDGSESMHGSAPMMAGAMAGAAGSTAQQIMTSRSTQMSRSGGQPAQSPQTPGSPKTGGPSAVSGQGAPKGSPGGGAGVMGGQSAKTGGQAASTASKAGATAGKAGATAGKAGATAGAGAATAGVGAGVMLAAQIAAAGANKAKETAGSMAPDVPRSDA